MRIGRKQKRKATEIDITPLMDVVFLLLIFFMVATSFHEETRALDVSLPRAENPKIITIDEQVLTITVTKDDRLFLDEVEIEPKALKDELDRFAMETGFRNVIVKGDESAKYRTIAAVLDALTMVETEGISFAVTYTSL